jgi:hypothetical protein
VQGAGHLGLLLGHHQLQQWRCIQRWIQSLRGVPLRQQELGADAAISSRNAVEPIDEELDGGVSDVHGYLAHAQLVDALLHDAGRLLEQSAPFVGNDVSDDGELLLHRLVDALL